MTGRASKRRSQLVQEYKDQIDAELVKHRLAGASEIINTAKNKWPGGEGYDARYKLIFHNIVTPMCRYFIACELRDADFKEWGNVP